MERPLDRPATLRRFAAPALVCSAILIASYVRTAEGTRHPSPWGYRLWAFSAMAYSDILALHEDRGARQHPLPYVEDAIEYPVLLGIAMWLPSVVAPERAGYFALTFVLLAACALGTLWFISSIPGTEPWVWGASPALLVYGALNWDLLAILPVAAGLWLWAKGRERWAVALLSLAVWTKFFPLLVLGVILLVSLRGGLRRTLELLGIFVGLTLLLNLPFALLGWARWAWFFEFNSARELEASLYLLFGGDRRGSVDAANVISAVVVLAAAAALAVLELRTRRLDSTGSGWWPQWRWRRRPSGWLRPPRCWRSPTTPSPSPGCTCKERRPGRRRSGSTTRYSGRWWRCAMPRCSPARCGRSPTASANRTCGPREL